MLWLGLGVDGLVQLELEPRMVPGVAFPGSMVGQLAPEIGVAFPGYMVGQLEYDFFLVHSPFYAGKSFSSSSSATSSIMSMPTSLSSFAC